MGTKPDWETSRGEQKNIISIIDSSSPLPPPPTMANVLQQVYRLAFPVALGGIVVQNSIYDVKGGTRAVIFDRSLVSRRGRQRGHTFPDPLVAAGDRLRCADKAEEHLHHDGK